jgi:hypothetical protein
MFRELKLEFLVSNEPTLRGWIVMLGRFVAECAWPVVLGGWPG